MSAPPEPGLPALRRKLRAARIEAALTQTGTALLLGFVLVAAAAAYVAGLRGLVLPSAWIIALGAGLPVVAGKMALDALDRSGDGARVRQVLSDAFGPDMARDAELSQQARMVIEFRARLAEAEAKSGSAGRRAVAGLVLNLDRWLDGMVRLAHEIAAHRGEAGFQSGLAARARGRHEEITARLPLADPALATQLRATLDGLSAQIAAAESYARFVETGRLKLEQSVAAFGAVSVEIGRSLTGAGSLGSATALFQRIGEEAGIVERQIARITQEAPALPAPEPAPAQAG